MQKAKFNFLFPSVIFSLLDFKENIKIMTPICFFSIKPDWRKRNEIQLHQIGGKRDDA